MINVKQALRIVTICAKLLVALLYGIFAKIRIKVINGIQLGNRYSKRVVNDSKGNMLFKIENGRIYNAKGKEIDSSDFRDKMYKMLEKGKLGEYIQYP